MTNRKRDPVGPSARRRHSEAILFLVASAVGIYALGNAFNGLLGSGGAVALGWFAVAGLAMFVLIAQMGRVHDTWPRSASGSTVHGAPRNATLGANQSVDRQDEDRR